MLFKVRGQCSMLEANRDTPPFRDNNDNIVIGEVVQLELRLLSISSQHDIFI